MNFVTYSASLFYSYHLLDLCTANVYTLCVCVCVRVCVRVCVLRACMWVGGINDGLVKQKMDYIVSK